MNTGSRSSPAATQPRAKNSSTRSPGRAGKSCLLTGALGRHDSQVDLGSGRRRDRTGGVAAIGHDPTGAVGLASGTFGFAGGAAGAGTVIGDVPVRDGARADIGSSAGICAGSKFGRNGRDVAQPRTGSDGIAARCGGLGVAGNIWAARTSGGGSFRSGN